MYRFSSTAQLSSSYELRTSWTPRKLKVLGPISSVGIGEVVSAAEFVVWNFEKWKKLIYEA